MFKTKSLSILVFIAANWAFGVFAAECETDPTACSIKELCSAATTIKRNHLEWNFDALDHVASAKSYGLTCGVDNAVKPAVDKLEVEVKFKKYDFTSLNQLQRHQIQYALKRLGYYSSSVDGLWGKGTERAANKFLLDENIKGNLAQNLYKALTSKVNVSSVTVQKTNRTTLVKNAPTSKKPSIEINNQSRQICRLDNDTSLDAMLNRNDDLNRNSKKAFNGLREIELVDGRLTILGKKLKPAADGMFKRYFNVKCVENINKWSRCGTFQAHTRLKIHENNTVKGNIIIPWEWAARTANIMKLEYTCGKG